MCVLTAFFQKKFEIIGFLAEAKFPSLVSHCGFMFEVWWTDIIRQIINCTLFRLWSHACPLLAGHQLASQNGRSVGTRSVAPAPRKGEELQQDSIYRTFHMKSSVRFTSILPQQTCSFQSYLNSLGSIEMHSNPKANSTQHSDKIIHCL